MTSYKKKRLAQGCSQKQKVLGYVSWRRSAGGRRAETCLACPCKLSAGSWSPGYSQFQCWQGQLSTSSLQGCGSAHFGVRGARGWELAAAPACAARVGKASSALPSPGLCCGGSNLLQKGGKKRQLKEIMSFTSRTKFARCCRSASSLPSARRVPPRLCSSRSLSGGTTGSMDTVAQQMWPWGMFAVLGTPKCCCISYLLVPQIVALSITACGPGSGTGGRVSRILALD